MPVPSQTEKHLPLKPVDLQLLIPLAEEERHGYALVQAIESGTNGLVQLDPGNLYRVIKRLLAAGLVAESGRRTPAGSNERRRYYRITRLGRQVLVAELRRLEALVASPPVRSLMSGWAT
jgi:DNA-binding PadR family transcriptional regulator